MIVLSLDPGIEKVGYAIIQKKINNKKINLINSGLIKTNKKLLIQKRLFQIYIFLEKLIKQHQPSIIVYEEIFFFKNKKTIISISQMQGIILLLAEINKIPIVKLSPLMIKQTITGYGLSDKKGIKKMVDKELSFSKKIISDDEYDAIACGLTYCYLNKNLLD